MPLIRSAIKYGALYGVAREGFKALDNHQQQQSSPPPPPPPQQQQQQYYSSRDPQQQQQQQQPYQNQTQLPREYLYRNSSGTLHQSWCNGTCGGQCASNGGNPPKYTQ